MRHVGDGDVDDEATAVIRGGVWLGMDGVVMVLGVGRIDGDERHLPPILAAVQGRGLRGLRFLLRLAAENGRDAVRVDGDQADRALARSEPRRSTTRAVGKPRRGALLVSTAIRSPSSASAVAPGRNGEFLAEHLLVDRLQAAAAVRQFARNIPSTRCLG